MVMSSAEADSSAKPNGNRNRSLLIVFSCFLLSLFSRKHREGLFRAERLDKLHRAKLHGAKLHRAKLHRAKLHRAKLHRAKLHRAKLHRARLHTAKWHRDTEPGGTEPRLGRACVA